MLLVSQNLLNYGMNFPPNTILRINLAWVKDLDALVKILGKFDKDIFLDLPTGRTKPPNYRYSMEDLKDIINSYDNVKYFAISNVETTSQVFNSYSFLSKNITLVPKIESIEGIKNIQAITESLREKEKILMLDHDDLFSNIIINEKDVDYYIDIIDELVTFCKNENITLLRTRGVIFSKDI